jgi:hypothetical protein
MTDVVLRLIFVLAGISMIIFRSPLARLQIRTQNDFWGFNMGERSKAVSRGVFVVIGLVLIVGGPLWVAFL